MCRERSKLNRFHLVCKESVRIRSGTTPKILRTRSENLKRMIVDNIISKKKFSSERSRKLRQSLVVDMRKDE